MIEPPLLLTNHAAQDGKTAQDAMNSVSQRFRAEHRATGEMAGSGHALFTLCMNKMWDEALELVPQCAKQELDYQNQYVRRPPAVSLRRVINPRSRLHAALLGPIRG